MPRPTAIILAANRTKPLSGSAYSDDWTLGVDRRNCHRRFQQWIRTGKLEEGLRLLAQLLYEQGKLNLEEALQSERLLNHMLRLRLTHLPNCFEAIAEEGPALPGLHRTGARSGESGIAAT